MCCIRISRPYVMYHVVTTCDTVTKDAIRSNLVSNVAQDSREDLHEKTSWNQQCIVV